MYISIEQAKKHLNIDEYFNDDDIYIGDLITAAEDAVSVNLNVRLCDVQRDGVLPSAVAHAILIEVANLYANRESVAYSNVHEVPHSYDYLISLYKDYNKTF